MLQIDVKTYVSDALEDAMRLAQTKAYNSYTFSDMLNYMNYAWMDVYQRINQMDSGYYSLTVPITKRVTRLPPFVKNSIIVYAAQSPIGYNREVFRSSGLNDLQGIGTYAISGFDLYCPDALRRNVWLNYIPIQQQLFFTMHNRDPKLYETYSRHRDPIFNMYTLEGMRDAVTAPIVLDDTTSISDIADCTIWRLHHRNANTPATDMYIDLSDTILHHDNDADTDDNWKLQYIHCDFPYLFVTYKHDITGEYYSGFFTDITGTPEFTEYNPFAFLGRNSNVEYIDVKWNDKTGLKAVVYDWNDIYTDNNGVVGPHIKELGWTPDSLLVYPAPEVYRYFVARLADKLSALNESNVSGVQKELVEAVYAFDNFLAKDKSSWTRIRNVNGPGVGDLL